jgi:CheY-like chemotaxis protein
VELHAERILIVEQPDGREMLKLALEHVGFEVDLANDGESALVIAAVRAPAVVIIDIKFAADGRLGAWATSASPVRSADTVGCPNESGRSRGSCA